MSTPPKTAPALGQKIWVIGAGMMGVTLIRGMLDAELVTRGDLIASVQTEASAENVSHDLGIETSTGYPPDWIATADIFLVCTKPYRVAEVLRALKSQGTMKEGAVVISIAAGCTIATMEEILGEVAVIRAMPNTPCRIRAGVTVISPGRHTNSVQMATAKRIFSSVGQCHQLAEPHLDAVTAVSGSGPAYIYLIMEALADGAVRVGLPRDVAFSLVSQTMLGAALMLQQSGKHPATLKDEVTTPSGCTIAALLTMEDGKIRSTLARAVEEATLTAKKLV